MPADMERKLGEVDRARKIYEYGSQFCDPRVRSRIDRANRLDQNFGP